MPRQNYAPTPEAPAVVATAAVIAPPQPKPKAKPGKVSLAGFNKKKESTKTEYPILPDPTGELYALAKTIKLQSQELEALEGALETNKAELRQRSLLPYFQINQGKTEAPSSVAIPTTEGEVLVTFSGRYKKMEDDSGIVSLFGQDFVDANLKQAFTITIAGEKLATADPSNPDRNPAQEFIDALQGLVDQFNAADAVTYKQEIKPTKEFHAHRHQLLTPDRNVTLDSLCSMVVMVKTKGRDAE